jgi:hypothetical protein
MGVSAMGFYELLLQAAWFITKEWTASYLLFPWTLIGLVSSLSGVILLEYWWRHRRVSRVIWHLLRIVLEAIIGLAATVGAMFAISLFYYAPPVVMRHVADDAAKAATIRVRQQDRKRMAALSAEVSRLQQQLRSDPLARKLAQTEDERDDALQQAASANDFVTRLTVAGRNLDRTEEDFEKAYERQQEEWSVLMSFFPDPMPLRPGISPNEALEESHEYQEMKANTRAAMRKLHDEAESFHILLQEGD